MTCKSGSFVILYILILFFGCVVTSKSNCGRQGLFSKSTNKCRKIEMLTKKDSMLVLKILYVGLTRLPATTFIF